MQTRFLVLFMLIIFTACQSGRIPCPKVKVDKLKKTAVKRNMRHAERNAVASLDVGSNPAPRTKLIRLPGTPPALEHMNVEEWDCPKPGTKRAIPKALKDNIRRNKKAYETYYKTRESADSLRAPQGGR